MLEKTIERHLNARVAECGGMCLKFRSSLNGVPDRVVIHKGKVYFIELKRDEGNVSKVQKLMQTRMKECGAEVFTLWNKGDVDWFVTEYL